ncbi:MAG: hypothetical protein OXU20_12235 [Myxococcales bacterium]|nr:hypothetical protein [Myxococcales bacterium]MDD9967839.1 hypothetical protein [Myxococcales bacterium]
MAPGNDPPDCVSALPPERPPSEGNSAELLQPLVFAVRTSHAGLSRDESNEWAYRGLGFDLDGYCTTEATGQGCLAPPGHAPIEDGRDGRDHSANDLFTLAKVLNLKHLIPDAAPVADSGRHTVLMVVRGYNGSRNDRQVTVELLAATLWLSTTEGPRAKWDGADVWHPMKDWLDDDGERARIADPNAYVRDYILVARVDRLVLGLPPQPTFPMENVIITGRLENQDEGLVLTEGNLVGSIPIDDMLVSLSRSDGLDPTPCRNRSDYAIAKERFCERVDIRLDGKPSQPCDALSTVFAISAFPAAMGETVPARAASPIDCMALRCGQNDPVDGGI